MVWQLVFDIEKQLFYFEGERYQEKILDKENECRVDRSLNVVTRGDEYFSLVLTSWVKSFSDDDYEDYSKYSPFPVYNQLRSYKVENGVLMEKELIWEGKKSYVYWGETFRNWIKVFSTVVVENVYLE